MKMQIGYLVPEFPGQTHIFYWRERQALSALGIETQLISTRLPPKAIASHTWADEAQKQTDYLVSRQIKDLLDAVIEVLRAGPVAWIRCLAVVMKAEDTSFKQKVRLLAMLLAAGKLAQLARTKRFRHLHVHSCADAANVALFAAILSGLTYSFTLHGPSLAVYGPNQKQKWKSAAFATVVSKRLLNEVQRDLEGYLPKQLTVAPMGVNLNEIKRRAAYIPSTSGGVCKVFSCGRLNPIKGHDHLINAVANLRQRGLNVHLKIAGEDEQGGTGYRKVIEKLICDHSLTDCVELLGAISESQIRQHLEDAHVFALASLNEGISVAVMEAMAMEIPVVVTEVGGMAELIDNGINGILIQPNAPEAMADAIADVLQNSKLAMHLSQMSRKKIASEFHERRSAEAIAHSLQAEMTTKGIAADWASI